MEQATPELFEWVDRFVAPEEVVWDIGANVGVFAFAASAKAGPKGHVLAMEPDIFLCSLLQQSAGERLPSTAPVDVLSVAASNTIGVAMLNISRRGRSANYLSSCSGSTSAGGVRDQQCVITITLDCLFAMSASRNPTLLKIDVETAELAVLSGAASLLSTAKPVVICEVAPENSNQIASLLLGHDYVLYDLEKLGRGPIRTAAYNTLAIPRDRSQASLGTLR